MLSNKLLATLTITEQFSLLVGEHVSMCDDTFELSVHSLMGKSKPCISQENFPPSKSQETKGQRSTTSLLSHYFQQLSWLLVCHLSPLPKGT